MKLHGYCTGCRKVKLVTVRMPVARGVQTGTCRDCANNADAAALPYTLKRLPPQT